MNPTIGAVLLLTRHRVDGLGVDHQRHTFFVWVFRTARAAAVMSPPWLSTAWARNLV
jgi:hypothetical protein